MKKLITVLILLAVGGGSAYYYYTYGKTQEKPTIQQLTISQADVTEVVSATGTLEALRTVPVGSQVSGVVQDLFADFNQIVTAGQVLAKIDPSLLQVQVDLQNANVERQKGEIESQKVQLEQSKTDLKRTQELFDKGLANQQQLDQAQLTVKTRMTSLDSAQKQLLTNEANLSQAKLNVDYTTIKSPIDGVVVNRTVDKGQTVQSSMSVATFFTLATDLRNLKLTAGVDEADIGKIRPDMPVTFTVDSYPQQTFYGTVNSVRLNAQTQNNVVTYPVWIDAPNPDLKLRPSMTAQIKVIISTAPNAVRIPNQALRFRPTADMYTSLGLTPPAAGQGRGLNAGAGGAGADGGGRRNRGENGAAPAAGAPGAPAAGAAPAAAGTTPPAGAAPGNQGTGAQASAGAAGGQGQGGNRQRGQNGQGQGGQMAQGGQTGQGGRGGQGGGQGGGRGFGAGMQNLTPEERERMRQQFAARGGGNGGGGRGGRGGQQQPSNVGVAPKPLNADKIDSLFAGVPKRIQGGNVWLWDEANKKLSEVRVQIGITDGQFSEMVSGDLKVGQQVVTNIIVPVKATTGNSSIFGNQPGRGNPGGLQPGGPGGAGGFGAPGGGGAGGGGRGGGGGGGGRGGI